MKLKYGTRGSPLALAQSDWAARRLEALHPGLELERVVIRTSGDRFIPGAPIRSSIVSPGTAGSGIVPAAAAPSAQPENVKALFVKEIEEALLAGRVDFAVHSCKDLPADLPEGLDITAYPEREDPRDVFIGGAKTRRWEDLRPGCVVGTSSLRRRLQIGLAKPGVSLAELRGNIDTRIKSLESGAVSGIVLAKAGLKRLSRDSTPHEVLPVDVMVPAPGQGALALESRSSRGDVRDILSTFDHAPTRTAVECERALMKAVGGGCRTPFGAYARLDGSEIRLDVFGSDEAGRRPVRRQARVPAQPAAVAALVERMARELTVSSGS